MSYTPQTWTDNNTGFPLSAARMTVLENGLQTAAATADSAATQATSALSAATTAQSGVTTLNALNTSRGKTIIPGAETLTSTSYSYMPTPDRVDSIVVPTDAIIELRAFGLWKVSQAATVSVAIFIGANQLTAMRIGQPPSTPIALETVLAPSAVTFYNWYQSSNPGIILYSGGISDAVSNTTGMALYNSSAAEGGEVHIVNVAAGTYNIGVQWKSTAGTISVKERKTYVNVLAI